ncbi:DNA repair protein RAD4 isoform X2 [Canna indica]|uniref:DNA repair protein RAD4 isoform X2 n=1 Tax=Canna indica TaxID=4628 RepID=A0AAQ3QD63_9LILI|nr:DNA repair protein RAD4 isoform X2 [Canna indica]
MRTRNQSKRHAEAPPAPVDSEAGTSSCGRPKRAKGSLEEQSVNRSKKPTFDAALSSKRRKQSGTSHGEPEEKVKESVGKNSDEKDTKECTGKLSQRSSSTTNANGSTLVKGEDVGDVIYDANELVWEEGTIPVSVNMEDYSHEVGREVTVEFDSPSSSQKKVPRRISAKDKELAELIHKVHLLCLLARGRIVDNACNDSLIQASLLSLLPPNLLKIGEIQKLTANRLFSFVNWFRDNFHVRSQSIDRGSFHANLAFALQTHEGTAEEVVALSVALFRALNLTTRFVSILDVASLKPDADTTGITKKNTESIDMRISTPSTPLLATGQSYVPSDINLLDKSNLCQVSNGDKFDESEHSPGCKKDLHKALTSAGSFNDGGGSSSTSKASDGKLDCCGKNLAEVSKRKGDLEFTLELQRAISATSAAVAENKRHSKNDQLPDCSSTPASSMEKLRQSSAVGSLVPTNSSGAVWSRRSGPPLYWAEVYCGGETLTGRWLHVDAANAIVDGAEKVEAAAAACRRPLKYVIAFAGYGAKDVTRRYCMHWYKIASKRINSQWWEAVLAPLKELESAASGSVVQLEGLQGNSSSEIEKASNSVDMNFTGSAQRPLGNANHADGLSKEPSRTEKSADLQASSICLGSASRDSLEDMELATRALTEPLPTNQLAYKNHHLYAIEKWLTKNQVLYPKGPILGYCSGHPVYPRSCVKTLQTKQKWLREGLQVRVGEIPAKVVKRSKNFVDNQTSEVDSFIEDCGKPSTELFGKWQLEPLKLPHAVNGIVPKNERGQVEVWSEKCLPPGTVHLRLPRLIPVAKRLEIDFAPAMVGFDFRNGRCVPMFEGIVICNEFKDAILEAYAEEEERRESEERKRNENQALSRWFQLLSSIITRQQLKSSYVDSSSIHEISLGDQKKCEQQKGNSPRKTPSQDASSKVLRPLLPSGHDHVHTFLVENQSFDKETSVLTKRCSCGFSIEVEEM